MMTVTAVAVRVAARVVRHRDGGGRRSSVCVSDLCSDGLCSHQQKHVHCEVCVRSPLASSDRSRARHPQAVQPSQRTNRRPVDSDANRSHAFDALQAHTPSASTRAQQARMRASPASAAVHVQQQRSEEQRPKGGTVATQTKRSRAVSPRPLAYSILRKPAQTPSCYAATHGMPRVVTQCTPRLLRLCLSMRRSPRDPFVFCLFLFVHTGPRVRVCMQRANRCDAHGSAHSY